MYFLPISLLFASSVAAHCSRSYTVKAGDWCDTISAAHQSSTYQLAYSNQGTINECCSNLHVGQSICLALKTGPDCTTTHVVKDADTCDTLATQYKTNTTMIMSNNPQLDHSCSIYPGQVLCVAPTLQAPVIPAGSKWVAPHPCQDDSSSSVYTPAASLVPTVPGTTSGGSDYPDTLTGGANATGTSTGGSASPDTSTTPADTTTGDDSTANSTSADDTIGASTTGNDTGSDDTMSTESITPKVKTKTATLAATNHSNHDGGDDDEDCEDDGEGDDNGSGSKPVVLNPESGSGDDSDDGEDCEDHGEGDNGDGDGVGEEDCEDDEEDGDGGDDDEEDCDDDEEGDNGDNSGDEEDCEEDEDSQDDGDDDDDDDCDDEENS